MKARMLCIGVLVTASLSLVSIQAFAEMPVYNMQRRADEQRLRAEEMAEALKLQAEEQGRMESEVRVPEKPSEEAGEEQEKNVQPGE
jgi:hypothetical protein